jgi:hypothetical protein
MEIHFSANRHIWCLDFDECNRLALQLGPLPLYFDDSGSISAGILCSFDHLVSQNLQERRDRVESRQHCLINEKAEEEARVILDHLTAQNRALAAIYETLQELQINADKANLRPCEAPICVKNMPAPDNF